MFEALKNLTDKWTLKAKYDPDANELKPESIYGEPWRSQRFEYSTGDLLYKGVHETFGAATSDNNWRIWKYTWDVDDNPVLIEGPVIGSWDDRASLGWE